MGLNDMLSSATYNKLFLININSKKIATSGKFRLKFDLL